jgi:MoxR-like ATPase
MTSYPFDLLSAAATGSADVDRALAERPFQEFKDSLRESAELYKPSLELRTAINTAIAVGAPLLLTGDSGTGKTQAAYYTAWRLGLDWPLEFSVKSTSQGRDLLYSFDSVRYFRDAWAQARAGAEGAPVPAALDKRGYVEPGKFWQALAHKDRTPLERVKVLLIDEIDKAPKDFPNDLLHELDELRFAVPEIDEEVVASKDHRPIVFITSNSERRLSELFLRRCVYHHITFDLDSLKTVTLRRVEAGVLPPLSLVNGGLPPADAEFLDQSRRVFQELRAKVRQKIPSTGEYLIWLQAFLHRFGADRERLAAPLKELELLHLLVKDKDDWRLVRG